MMTQGFEEIIGSDGCDDNDIMWWPIVIAIIRSHVNYTEMMTDGDWSGVMMTMSVLTSVSWHHVTNVTWHQLRPRDMCLRLSPVTKLSISSIQMSLSLRLACLSVRSSGHQRAGWIELKSFEMINITSPHWTDPKNHHLQCAHWARVDKNCLRSTPNVFTSSRIIIVEVMKFKWHLRCLNMMWTRWWWWPRVPMVQWSLVLRPPHVTLSAPDIFAYCEMLPRLLDTWDR